MRKQQKSRNRDITGDMFMAKHADALAGREQELRKLRLHIRNRENLHIYGSEGTGKSALLDWIYDNWQEIDNILIPMAGADRSGLVAAMWKVAVDKEPMEEATKQLSVYFGHIPFNGKYAMDRFFQKWSSSYRY